MVEPMLSKLASCPLDPVWHPGVEGRAGTPGVIMERTTPNAMALISYWSGQARNAEKVLAIVDNKISGGSEKLKLPLPGHSIVAESLRISDLGGGRLLVESEAPELLSELNVPMKPNIGTVTDLSDARTIISLSGPKTRWVLSKLFPVDFDPTVFVVGRFAQTSVHHMPVFVHHESENCYRLGMFTTYAESTHDVLTIAAQEVGLKRV